MIPSRKTPTQANLPVTSARDESESLQRESTRQRQLWLCIYLPDLPLEVFTRFSRDRQPLAVVDEKAGHSRVFALNDSAREGGLRVGLKLNAAYALIPDLHAVERNGRLELEALQRLACWCGQFTPLISFELPGALLLEVLGSLRLFGGKAALYRRIQNGLTRLGYSARLRSAPTPLAALWLARAESRGCADAPVDPAELSELPGCLGELAIEYLQWPEEILQSLQGMGIRTLRDFLRLPRDGLARRFGRHYLYEIDKALGRRPDLRQYYAPPARFAAHVELPAEVCEAKILRHAAERLLADLIGFLKAHQVGVRELSFRLYHRGIPATRFVLRLLEPSADPQHLLELFTERLEHLELTEPVISLAMRSGPLQPLPFSTAELFPESAMKSPEGAILRLVERLRARLGVEAVNSVSLVPDHRPEVAWRSVEPDIVREGKARDTVIFPPRPLWIFSEPVRLPHAEKLSGLEFISGPERIETGWWDGKSVARDYFVAADSQGVRLWIYRERRWPRDWFIHGVYG